MDRKRASRPFILSDAMILVAAIALGLGLGLAQYRFHMARAAADARALDLPEPPPDLEINPEFQAIIDSGIQDDHIPAIRFSLSTFLISLCLGQLVLCLREPRPNLRRSIPRIAAVTSLVTLFFVILALADTIIWFGCKRSFDWYAIQKDFSHVVIDYVGSGVLLVWTGLVASGKFHVRGWLDWSGLILGLLWIATSLINYCLTFRWFIP